MKEFSLKGAAIHSATLIINNFSAVVPFILIFIISNLAITWYGLTYPLAEGLELAPFLSENLLVIVVSYIFTKTILRLAENKPATLKDLDLSFSEGLRYSIIGTLYFLLVIVGFILLIIPGIYFSLKYFFVPIVILDKNISIKEAWSQSAKLTEGKKLKLLPFISINMLILILIHAFTFESNLRYITNAITTVLECILYTVISIEIYLQHKSKT